MPALPQSSSPSSCVPTPSIPPESPWHGGSGARAVRVRGHLKPWPEEDGFGLPWFCAGAQHGLEPPGVHGGQVWDTWGHCGTLWNTVGQGWLGALQLGAGWSTAWRGCVRSPSPGSVSGGSCEPWGSSVSPSQPPGQLCVPIPAPGPALCPHPCPFCGSGAPFGSPARFPLCNSQFLQP
ncbi:hypothetical protein Nmel_017680 [Mimus melanotis]